MLESIRELRTYRGYFTDGGVTMAQIYQRDGHVPVILVTELPQNANTSVTNMAEYLAVEVLVDHLPALLGTSDFIWIEHYPRNTAIREDVFSKVLFADYQPKTVTKFGHIVRQKLGTPTWSHLDYATVRQLIGDAELQALLDENWTSISVPPSFAE